MHKNKIWIVFLTLFFLGVIGYSIFTIIKFVDYSTYTARTKPYEIKLFPESDFFGRYSLRGKYSFLFKDKIYKGEDTVDSNFQNSYAVEKVKDKYLENMFIWFNPENPTHSTIHKKFPMKEGIYFLILWGIAIYFIGLGFHVSKFTRR